MKRINSLSDLLLEELADLLNAKAQLIKALPKMAEASQSLTLKLVLEAQLEVAKEHSKRLQSILGGIREDPQRPTHKTVSGLIQESEDVVTRTENGQTRDIAIISLMQRLEQHEISGYMLASEHAIELGHTRIVELLNKIINEEREMKLHLSELAQGMINVQAIDPKRAGREANKQVSPAKPKSEGFYIPEGKFNRGGLKKKDKNTDVSRFISEGNPNIEDDGDKGKG